MAVISIENGCTGSSFDLDGKSIYDLPKEEIKEICIKLVGKYADIEIIRNIVEMQGEYFSDEEPCEQCGNIFDGYYLEF